LLRFESVHRGHDYENYNNYENTRLARLYAKRELLSDRKLNNLLKRFRLIKVFKTVK
jgi:hypothetical protein